MRQRVVGLPGGAFNRVDVARDAVLGCVVGLFRPCLERLRSDLLKRRAQRLAVPMDVQVKLIESGLVVRVLLLVLRQPVRRQHALRTSEMGAAVIAQAHRPQRIGRLGTRAGSEITSCPERLHILCAGQDHHHAVMAAGRAHDVTRHHVIGHLPATLRHVVAQTHRTVGIERGATQTKLRRLDLRQCAAEGVTGDGDVVFGNALLLRLVEHFPGEGIGGCLLRIDPIPHHREVGDCIRHGGARVMQQVW
ncbi:hypothetical protein, partial [Xanthomonas sp. MUS 060]|uniref:hypothetical protein n=1 Tax=Xanthomonas sp. MUS 060 TaxID=1588031 RepID=UPI0031B61B37